MSRQLLAVLAEGPQAAEALTQRLGIKRTHLHTLIHKQGSKIVRFDLTPECGRSARPVYGLRPWSRSV